MEKQSEPRRRGWTSPSHRPYRSPALALGHVRGILTDKQIHAYALKGFYGSARQRAAQLVDETRASTKTKKKTKTHTEQRALSRALKLLSDV